MLVVMGNWNTKVHVGRPYSTRGRKELSENMHCLAGNRTNNGGELDCEFKLCSQSAIMFPHKDYP